MKRRNFISCTTLASIGLLSCNIPAQSPKKNKLNAKCKITVLKRTIYQDLYDKYKGRKGELCPVLKDNQEFLVTSPYRPPEGFCKWAWADIRHYIQSVYYERPDIVIACCTDGLRPVIFKLESIIN